MPKKSINLPRHRNKNDGKKSVIAISDPHCGHRTGLTMPKYLASCNPGHYDYYFYCIRKTISEWFVEKIEQIRGKYGIDVCLSVGDTIEGNGHKNGGTELICSDRNHQVEMACSIFEFIGAKENHFVTGTPAHIGKEEDYEYLVAKGVNANYGIHKSVSVNGLYFDIKHKISRAATAFDREKQSNLLWQEKGIFEAYDIMLRGHNHGYKGKFNWRELQMVLPAMMWESNFGKRECLEPVDVGFVHFLIDEPKTITVLDPDPDSRSYSEYTEKPNYTWQAHLLDLKVFKQECIVV